MMKTIQSGEIKRQAINLGVDLCGIASVECFADAPSGFHPTDIVKECKSVIVLASRFPVSALFVSSPAAYTFAMLKSADKMDSVTFQIALELEKLGSCAVAIPSRDPYDYWDESRRHGQGILSLKHAAVRAGLGQIGKNTLLVNKQLGNALFLGGILLDAELEPDPVAAYQTCPQECRVCLDSCPVNALDGTTIAQSKCRSNSGKYTEGGGAVYACNLCRRNCPHHQGIKGN